MAKKETSDLDRIRVILDAGAAAGLTVKDKMVLVALVAFGVGVPRYRLTALVSLQEETLRRTLRRLRQGGLVSVKPDPQDRRRSLLTVHVDRLLTTYNPDTGLLTYMRPLPREPRGNE